MSEKYAIITGASSGIGLELSRELAKERYDLILIARRKEKLRELSETLSKQYSVSVNYIDFDLTKINEINYLVNRILNITRKIDLLINNAGAGIYGPLQALRDEDIVNIINLNYVAPILLTKKLLQYIIERRGCIVNIVSVAAYIPMPKLEIYSSTKAALSIFTRALRIELKPYGVRVIGVYPGYVDTSFHINTIKALDKEILKRPNRILVIRPEHVAKEVVKKIKDKNFNDDIIVSRIYLLPTLLATRLPELVEFYIEHKYHKEFLKMRR